MTVNSSYFGVVAPTACRACCYHNRMDIITEGLVRELARWGTTVWASNVSQKRIWTNIA